MKSLVFDSGPIITLTMNNLLWLMDDLKTRFKGEFYISPTVRIELVDKPMKTKRFKFEALQVLKLISNGVIKEFENKEIMQKSDELLELANSCLMAKGHYLKIVHRGEIECIALALFLESSAIVVDERTTRYLIDKPYQLVKFMRRKLHTNVTVDKENMEKLKKQLKGLEVLRSVELMTIAYELGLLDFYITHAEKASMPDIKITLLESVLWGAKLNGCAVSREEIDSIIRHESKSS